MGKKGGLQGLIPLLEKAERILAEYRGGYSGEYIDARDFHRDFVLELESLKQGNNAAINRFRHWFTPTCEWDDFVGKEGQKLANKIYRILLEMEKS